MSDTLFKQIKAGILSLGFVVSIIFARIDSGIVALWHFDEEVGDSTFDLSGNGSHFNLLNGTARVPGLNGNALYFDGIDDKGLCADLPVQTGMTALTIESVVWLNRYPANNHWGPVIGKWSPGSTEDDAWALDISRSSPYGGHGVVVGSSTQHIFGATPVPVGRWTHLVSTYDGEFLRIFIDGKMVDSNPVSNVGPIKNSDTNIRLGHNVDPHFFDGKIDQITLYERALSSEEIIHNYDSLFSNDQKVIAHWTFDEEVGDSAYDLSGNENHFKLLNGVQRVPSKNGYALKFDGIDDKGLCVDKPIQTGMSALTIESVIWVEHHSASQWGPVIVKWGPGSTPDDAWGLDVDRYSPYGGHGVVVGTSTQHINGTTPVPIQRWLHFVFTWDGTKSAIYLNGERVDSATVPDIGPIQDSDTEIMLGHNSDPHFFNGIIDQVTLYSYALDPDTILAHFEDLVGPSHEINIGMKTHYVQPGDELWVPVFITNFEDDISLNSIEFSLNIDTSVITFLEVSSDSGIAGNWTLAHNSFADSIKFSMGGAGQTISYGEGELLRCKFAVKPGLANGSFSDLIPSDVLLDEGGNVFPTTTIGKIVIDDISVLYGDVSGNGDVTAYDAAGIVIYVMGLLELPDQNYPNFTLQVADVSGDGAITSYDAALVFQYSVGLIQKFPVETNQTVCKRDGFPDAGYKLTKSPLSTASTVYYDLIAKNIKGAISSDIQIRYDPKKVLVELGGTITTTEPVNIESVLDTVNKIIKLSITTTDDFDVKGNIKMATIEVPVPDTNSLAGGMLFIKALINEEEVQDLDPSITVENISDSENKINFRKQIVINNGGLFIQNFKKQSGIVALYDLRGREILYRQFNGANDLIKIDLSNFAPSLYLYKIKIGSELVTKHFVKMR